MQRNKQTKKYLNSIQKFDELIKTKDKKTLKSTINFLIKKKSPQNLLKTK
jgi:hypothetical protein